jgi:hypothetical protein
MTLTVFSAAQSTLSSKDLGNNSQMIQLVTRTLTKWFFLDGLMQYTPQKQMAIRRMCLQMTQCSRMSHSGLMMALLYVQRILKTPLLSLTTFQSPELGLLTMGFIFSDIQINDCTISMSYWSKLSGIPRQELCRMKQRVLVDMNFDMYVTQDQYNEFVKNVQWMNYTQKPLETALAMPPPIYLPAKLLFLELLQ